MKNTTREESTTTKPLGMKWYKFLIYFALFAGAFVNFIYGINYISGGIYVVETNGLITADTVYKLYGVGLQVVDILYGLFLLALAVFCLVLRNQLAKYKPDAPHFARIFYSILAGAPFLYSIIVALITSQSLGIEAILSLIVGLIFTLWNVEYFKKRAHLFTDNPTTLQEDAPAPSQMQNDVPVTPSATVTEESPEESNVATENNPPQEEKAIQSENAPKKAKRYCSLCGGEIDADTKKCAQCGKQYFKGFTKTGIALIVVSVLLLVSIIVNLVQASDIEWYKNRIHQIRNEYGAAASFYDEYAVCVSNINDYYHKYGCSRFDDSEFWIFNLEYAEYQGYQPCPYCCD